MKTTAFGIHGLQCLQRSDEDPRFDSDDEARAHVMAALAAFDSLRRDDMRLLRTVLAARIYDLRRFLTEPGTDRTTTSNVSYLSDLELTFDRLDVAIRASLEERD